MAMRKQGHAVSDRTSGLSMKSDTFVSRVCD
jgi:hypothetical protein